MFSVWVNQSLYADKDKKIVPYDMVIKLLREDGTPLVGWNCSRAYPVKWSLGGLSSLESGLAMESIVICCNRVERLEL